MKDNSPIYNAIPIIFEDKIHKDSLFHYTSITGALLMLKDIQNKKCHLFAGNMMYQNDKNELREGIEIVKGIETTEDEYKKIVVECINDLNDNIYISCFSSQRDLLEQWKYYGKDCGLSIEFDFSECEGFWQEGAEISEETKQVVKYNTRMNNKDIDKYIDEFINGKESSDYNDVIKMETEFSNTRGGIDLKPLDVIYDDKLKVEYVEKLVVSQRENILKKLDIQKTEERIKGYIDCAISTLIPICKNRFFEHEKESRLLFYPMEKTKVEYREKNSRILPFIKCTIVNKDANKYPIKSITIGPGNNQNLVFNAIINLLEGNSNENFYTEEYCDNILKQDISFTDESQVIDKTEFQEMTCIKNEITSEKVLVYHSVGNILVYKSPIPFRD